MTAKETEGLRDMCTFIVLIYVEYWFTAPRAIQAPRRDLNLMKGLLDYRDINSSILQATSEKLKRHLWYLSEENIVLALYDDAVSLATKRKMLLAMKRNNNDQEVGKPEKRCNWSLATVAKSNLDSFASSKSLFFRDFKY